jgi:diketogulonate reductase-like aldo/keto reductase
MEFKALGETGIQVPEIGLGTWQYRAGVVPLRKGISLGASFIDTAEMYSTEGVVGEAVKETRHEVFIATKVSPDHFRYDQVLIAADRSLKRLRTDYIDLYQLHWPNPSIPVKETMRAMETLVDMGKIRFIGVSNFSVSDLEEAQASMGKYRIVSNQVKYSLFHKEIEAQLLPYCQRHKITVIAYSPLARGKLASRPLLKQRRAFNVLQRIAKETGRTIAQVALNWCISQPGVIAIPKSDRVERVVENCETSGWRLSAKQAEALAEAFR